MTPVHNQYHDWQWPGDVRSQGIIRHNLLLHIKGQVCLSRLTAWEERSALIIQEEECRETIKTRQDKVTFSPLSTYLVWDYIMSGHAFVVAFHHRNNNILKLWEWWNDEKEFFLSKFNHINKHLYLENNFNHLKLRYPDPCNFLTKRVLGEPTKHACGC